MLESRRPLFQEGIKHRPTPGRECSCNRQQIKRLKQNYSSSRVYGYLEQGETLLQKQHSLGDNTSYRSFTTKPLPQHSVNTHTKSWECVYTGILMRVQT